MKFLPMPTAIAQRSKMNSAWFDYVVAGENRDLDGQERGLRRLLRTVIETAKLHEFDLIERPFTPSEISNIFKEDKCAE